MRLYLALYLILSAASLLANGCRCRFSQWSNWSNWSGCRECDQGHQPLLDPKCVCGYPHDGTYQGSSIKDVQI